MLSFFINPTFQEKCRVKQNKLHWPKAIFSILLWKKYMISCKMKFYFEKYNFQDHHPKNICLAMAWPDCPIQKESRLRGESPLLDDYKLPFFGFPFVPVWLLGHKSTAQLYCNIHKPRTFHLSIHQSTCGMPHSTASSNFFIFFFSINNNFNLYS